MFAVATAVAMLFSLPTPSAPAASLTVRVDSARHYVVLTSGKYDLPAGMGDQQASSGMADMSMTMSKLMRFTFPIDGWLHGVKLRIIDASDKPLSRRLIHHINVINFGRRQLFYPVPELSIAMGQETEDIHLPATVGVPMTSAMPMALFIMFDNETPQEIKGVTVELTIEYSPTNLVPRPLSVLPSYMDVVYPVGRDVDFDLPPGETRYTADFKLAVGGRIIGAGGHAHDYATGISLFDVTNGGSRLLVRLKTPQASDGHLLSIERILPGLTGNGIRLQEGRTYRLQGSYNNTTGKTRVKGAMLHLILLYAPDRLEQWPKLDVNDPDWKKDIARLEERVNGMGGMKME